MTKSKDDVVIVAQARTPVGLFGGALRDYLGIDMATWVIKDLVKKAGLEDKTSEIGDVILGQMYHRNKEEPNVGRLAAWQAGLGDEVPGMTLQRACAVGLQAIMTGAQEIMAGQCDIVIAGGTDSMSNAPYEVYGLRWGVKTMNQELFDGMYVPILACPPTGTGMGMTAENLADKFDISREEMDEYAVMSHQRAAKATKEGKFKGHIVQVTMPGKKGQPDKIFDTDEAIRADLSLEKISQLKPVFKKGGKVTVANACPLNDGAAAVILMRRSKAEELGLEPLATYRTGTVVGCDPDIMGYGPTKAAKKLMEKNSWSASDIDLYQIHEPFAPIPLTFKKEIGISFDVMNLNGGPIAIGHAIGATGATLSMILIDEMKRQNVKRGLVGICQGTGMGTAVVFERD
ncbi:MAG: thiolase family protein [Thermincola sp.]|nr:thiolase family protein [Thermincola sp.]MDT3704982.1 thiolase family protein [Thermincola sp.]